MAIKYKKIIYKIILWIVLFAIVIIFVIPSVFILIFTFRIPKQPISKVPLQKGENGIYIGMNIDDFKKNGKHFEPIWGEFFTHEIKNFPANAEYTDFFVDKEKKIVGFRSHYTMNSEMEFKLIINKYEFLYGVPCILKESGGEIFRWSDNKTTISIYHNTWNSFRVEYSTEEEKLSKKLWEDEGDGKWYNLEYSKRSPKTQLSWLDDISCFWSLFFSVFECKE